MSSDWMGNPTSLEDMTKDDIAIDIGLAIKAIEEAISALSGVSDVLDTVSNPIGVVKATNTIVIGVMRDAVALLSQVKASLDGE